MASIIRTENLVKDYGTGAFANDNICMDIEENTVHAIVGENGAGKSTFVNIISGVTTKTSGKIFIKGVETKLSSTKDAIKLGIGMVSQHFRLIPTLTTTENIILGEERCSKLYLDRKKAEIEIQELSKTYGLSVDPKAKICDVSVGQQQRVEILKALYRKSDILILDEPTAVLTPQEIKELGVIIKNLKDLGKTIIIITHKLQEVMDFTEKITVFRQGKKIGDLLTKDTSPTMITEMMVGRSIKLGGTVLKTTNASHELALDIKNINFKHKSGKELKNINLHVCKGEIVGIAGVDGSGQSQLIDLISGAKKTQVGSIIMNGNNIQNMNIRQIKNNSFGYIPQDRHKDGLILDFSIEENLLLGLENKSEYKSNKIFLHKENINKNSLEKIASYDIRTSSETLKASSLSGGNQQKIIIGRECGENPDFILVAQPTRGLDVGAIEFVHDTLINLKNENKAVLMVSFELDEILALCDRVYVMCAGEITGELEREDFNREKIGLMMIGKEGVKSE